MIYATNLNYLILLHHLYETSRLNTIVIINALNLKPFKNGWNGKFYLQIIF